MRGTIEGYVRQVGELLPSCRGVRKDLLAELRDGLDDAAEAYRHTGLDPRLAELRAVREAGPAPAVAAAYHAELAASQGQRTAVLLGLSLPGVVLVWSCLWRFAGDTVTAGQWPVSELTMVLSRVVDWAAYAGGAFALAGLAVLLWLARSGRTADGVVKAVALVGAAFLVVHVGSNVAMNVLLIEGGFDWRMLFFGPAMLLGSLTTVLTIVQARSLWRTLRISFDRRARTS